MIRTIKAKPRRAEAFAESDSCELPIQIGSITPREASAIVTALGDGVETYRFIEETLEIPAVVEGLPWDAYEAFLDAVGDHRLRHSYDEGTLEMSPLKSHEWASYALTILVQLTCIEYAIPFIGMGSTTFRRRRAKRGFEPDASFYLNEGALRFDPGVPIERKGPGPDLVIEVDNTRSSVARMPLFAAAGVKEVWRWRGGRLEIHRLGKRNKYASTARSAVLPMVSAADLQPFVEQFRGKDETAVVQAFLAWLRRKKGEKRK